MTLHLRVVSHSEVGLVRKNNQDSGYASAQLMVVADGMGGAAAGDLASAVAIEVIRRLVTDDTGLTQDATDTRTETDTSTETETETNLPPTGSENLEDTAPLDVAAEPGLAGRPPMLARFVESIAEANARIADLVAADYNLEGMGTTVTGAVFDGQRLGLAHIGDSRAYLLRDGTLERLTHDHSWVQSLVDDGKISAEEAAYHPHRSLLLKVLNGQPANDPDVTTVDLRVGDRLLFCSDGLCGLVDDSRIAELAGLADLDQAGTDLVSEALAEGGIDNITVILAEVLEGPDEAVGAGVAAGPTVLGAAAHREIPVVPRAPHAAPGPDSEDESPANARTAAQGAARAGPARHPADD
ncbi:MAG: protein phosphatase 2C domain-containing protein, partial [Microlunatus sp.]|nr:protein phosphatase 2C domain-containing protein [Microlunatus sp.]